MARDSRGPTQNILWLFSFFYFSYIANRPHFSTDFEAFFGETALMLTWVKSYRNILYMFWVMFVVIYCSIQCDTHKSIYESKFIIKLWRRAKVLTAKHGCQIDLSVYSIIIRLFLTLTKSMDIDWHKLISWAVGYWSRFICSRLLHHTSVPAFRCALHTATHHSMQSPKMAIMEAVIYIALASLCS
jgi:hypothetical protein